MVRWEPDSRGRLAQAAMALYAERGFDDTTVAQIAQRAGLTERTFFRHFADKREVLFAGADELVACFVSAIESAPPTATPIDAVACSLEAAAAVFAPRREGSKRRQAVIAANPELQERELIKLARLAHAMADALRRRGVKDPAATLSAEAGVTVFRVGFEEWVRPATTTELSQLFCAALSELKAVTAGR